MADFFEKICCIYCQEEINGVIVQCCECPEFDICLHCFAAGAEIGSHKCTHPYKFLDHCAVSIFGGNSSWTGREHLRLLEAAELYIYGSWDLVAKNVKTRTAEECKDEYVSRYLDGNIGLLTWHNVSKPKLKNDLAEDNGPLSPTAMAKLAPLDATPEEARELGYKPHRDDFEREYDPEAEQLVADLQLEDPDETEMEKSLKLAILDMYFRRLRERYKRKRIVRDYQLVAKYFDNLRRDPSKPLYNKAQKELRDRMAPFAQFLHSSEHDRIISSIERHRELKHRLSQLKRYRSLGMSTREEIMHYEQHVIHQRQQIKQGKMGTNGYAALRDIRNLFFTPETCEDDVDLNSIAGKTTWPLEKDLGYDNGGRCSTTKGGTRRNHSHSTNPNELYKINFRALPMGKLLSQGEIDLCTHLKLQPIMYITMKYLIIQDNLLNPGKYDYLLKVEPNPLEINVKDEVIRYLLEAGWLSRLSFK